jgi:hypothetical protein
VVLPTWEPGCYYWDQLIVPAPPPKLIAPPPMPTSQPPPAILSPPTPGQTVIGLECTLRFSPRSATPNCLAKDTGIYACPTKSISYRHDSTKSSGLRLRHLSIFYFLFPIQDIPNPSAVGIVLSKARHGNSQFPPNKGVYTAKSLTPQRCW